MKRICPVDVSALLPAVAALSWPRQGNMIALSHFPPALALDAGVLIGQVLACLPGQAAGRSFRRGVVYLSRRVPGEYIGPHTDREDGGCTLRIHVPLVTNERAQLLLDGVWQHLEAGFAWAIDPTREHAVRNEGVTDRIHLFFNAVGS